MCGIAGWIAYDRDLTSARELATLTAMTRTMECRGPDAGGVWTAAHAALGHRRLAVVDVKGGRQPMTVEEDGRTALVMTYSGEVYNYRELRDELTGLGHRFRTRSDTEVVLRAYLAWGERFTERLNGMYALGLWDPRAEELLLVRDRMGIKPLYYQPTPAGVVFGSEPKALFAHPDVEPVVDLDGLRELLSFTKTPGHAVYASMREVRPGHVVRVTATGVVERQYWALAGEEHGDDLPTTVATVRELLDDIVARQLVSDVPLCTLLSGGLDSSVIAALAAGHLRAGGRGPVRSFAVDFAGADSYFSADSQRATLDGPYAHALAEHVGADHRDVVLDTATLMAPEHRAATLRARDMPTGLGDGDASFYLLCRAIREHSTVALSGESADELFGGYRWFHDAGAVAADTFPWVAEAEDFAGGNGAREALLDAALLRDLDLSGYCRTRYREALAEVPHLDTVTDPFERRMREVSYLHLTRFVQILLDRKDRVSMATGLEVRVPYCDHRLVSYVFNTPWSMKTHDGREKSLLRAAARDVLPESVADRVKSAYPSTRDPEYAWSLQAELKHVLEDPATPVGDFLDTRAVRRATAADSDPGTLRNGVELALMLNSWLRAYDVRLKL